MSKQDNGGPAFPNITPDMSIQGGPGMTLRDYFAAHAPDEVFDVEHWSSAECAKAVGVSEYRYREHLPLLLARLAYEYADAMLQARQS